MKKTLVKYPFLTKEVDKLTGQCYTIITKRGTQKERGKDNAEHND